jgi:AP-3 complex subunit delta-1
MLNPQVSSLPGHIQAVYVHNILKLIAAILSKSDETDTDSIQQVIFLNN